MQVQHTFYLVASLHFSGRLVIFAGTDTNECLTNEEIPDVTALLCYLKTNVLLATDNTLIE